MPRRELSLEHRAWIVENLLAGVPESELVTKLAKQLSRARARREVRAVATSPLLGVCGQLARRAHRLELAHALGRVHAAAEPDKTRVERRTLPGADEFFRTYWAAHRPVVLTDVVTKWPALRKWTPAWFAKTLGDVTIEIMTGRDADPHYDANIHAHRTRTRLDRYLAQIAAGPTNDIYMVSNNHTMKRPRFARLLRDVKPPRALFEPLRASTTSLWIGPAGTITPLHHDTTNILFGQIYGRKRIELVSPHETALLLDPDGFYSPVDLDKPRGHPALRTMTVKTVVVGPGDALFIPAGWWHRVTSLDVSISFSLLGFRRPNSFAWYRPGHIA